MGGVKVIDNCIPFELQNQIENLAQRSNIKFAYDEYTTPPSSYNSKYQDGSQLVNRFIEGGKFIVEDASHFFLLPLQIVLLQENHHFNLQGIKRHWDQRY